MTSKLISSAAIRKPAKDENTTLRANLAFVSSKKSEKIDDYELKLNKSRSWLMI